MPVVINLDRLLLPRLTTVQRDAIAAVNGMLIYNTTLNEFQGYESGAWANAVGDALGAAITVDSVTLDVANADIVLNRAGVGIARFTNAIDGVSQELFRLENTRATRAINDAIFMTGFMPTTDGTQEEFARFTITALAVTDAAESGALDITVPFGGLSHRMVRMQSGTPGIVFNPDQEDVNFVIASPALVNAFEMDAGRNTVGIGEGANTNVQLSILNAHTLSLAALEMIRISATRTAQANADSMFFTFRQQNSTPTLFEFGRITNVITNVTAGSEGGALRFNVSCPSSGGGSVLMVDMDGTAEAVIVNPSQTGVTDFIARGVNEAFLLVVDSGAEVVSIGGPVTTGVMLTIEEDVNTADIEIFRLKSTRATRAIGDSIHQSFFQPDSAGTQLESGRITSELNSVTAGAIDAQLRFDVPQAGVLREFLRLTTSAAGAMLVTFNDDQLDIDFQIESANTAFAFHIDAGGDAIGIGNTAIAGRKLTVQDDADQVSAHITSFRALHLTRADNDELFVTYELNTDTALAFEAVRFTAIGEDVSNAAKASGYQFEGFQSNSFIIVQQWNATAGVNVSSYQINPGAVDMDFQVSGNAEAQLFVCNAGLDTVGIGGDAISGVQLTIEDDTNEASAEMIRFRETRSTRANNDEMYLGFWQPDSTGALLEFHRISMIATDVTGASGEEGLFEFEAVTAGSLAQVFRVGYIAAGPAFQYGFGTSLATRGTFILNEATDDFTLDDTETTLNNQQVLRALISTLQAHGIVL